MTRRFEVVVTRPDGDDRDLPTAEEVVEVLGCGALVPLAWNIEVVEADGTEWRSSPGAVEVA
jgi:hypothetical protein